jgi:hypothetical protein
MALVRISKQLIADVRARVQYLRDAEINEAPTPATTRQACTGDGAEPLAAFVLWGEHLHLKSQMPEQWLTRAQKVSFRTAYTHDDGHVERTATVAVEGVTLCAPPGTNVYWNGNVDVDVPYSTIEEAASNELSPYHTTAKYVMEMVEHEKRRRRINRTWAPRETQLVQFLEKCKSLNEAIKLWPQIKLYVPKDYIDTVETPVVRPQAVTRKEKVTEGLDSDGLTAAAIAARLAGVV